MEQPRVLNISSHVRKILTPIISRTFAVWLCDSVSILQLQQSYFNTVDTQKLYNYQGQ